MVCDYQYDEETQRMRVNCLGCVYGSSHEDFDVCMAQTISKLMELKRVPSRIILAREREYEYDFLEAKMLLEIANAITKIRMEKIASIKNILADPRCEKCAPQRYAFLQRLINDIKYDPVEAYKQLIREIRHVNIILKKTTESGQSEDTELCEKCMEHYLNRALTPIRNVLDNCRIIQLSKEDPNASGRELYRKIFHPSIRPNFMYTSFISIPPAGGELLERYNMGDTQVEIYQVAGKVRKFYHIVPPEFKLNEAEYSLLDTARRYLGRHEPREAELTEPASFRESIYNISLDMLRDLTKSMNIQMSEKRMQMMADILTRYTAGLGILELFLADEKIQDIAINSPVGSTPIYVLHGDYEECETNIILSREDAESLATRFRLQSGRPLDEANPVLDSEIIVPGGRARVAAITRTLSPDGLGFALRRHRDKPWTLPLFIKNGMIDSFSAGLLWFLIDGSRTLLIAGTRGSGKTSFLGSCMVQIMPKLRIITVEDSVAGDCQILYEKN
ncbi:MAG: type II/IV secretion system ATPase subunit, partial [Candidatus Aenigmarchaeota archaeon]|nr:type II/IV secretion system ATPase subunit [Candidatus Aenigmarchaeota archaeon]